VRLAARAIRVADNVQRWANHIDVGDGGLLAASDQIVAAIAHALAVDLDLPARPALEARLAELYLEAKAQLRAGWIQGEGEIRPVIESLERMLPQAPDDASILALLSMALARLGFRAVSADSPNPLDRARVLAERAVAFAPRSADAWLAYAWSRLYSGEATAAARGFLRAVTASPSHAMAQSMLGALLLEANVLDQAVLHLEAAVSIEPALLPVSELARAYAYTGQSQRGIALLEALPINPYCELFIGRLKSWGRERYVYRIADDATLPPDIARTTVLSKPFYATGRLSRTDAEEIMKLGRELPSRYRASRMQYLTEVFTEAGFPDMALEALASSVESGLHDVCWIERCPLLEPLRGTPAFEQAAAAVRQRAAAVVAAMQLT
jgi:serine/threonine-protein kinase